MSARQVPVGQSSNAWESTVLARLDDLSILRERKNDRCKAFRLVRSFPPNGLFESSRRTIYEDVPNPVFSEIEDAYEKYTPQSATVDMPKYDSS